MAETFLKFLAKLHKLVILVKIAHTMLQCLAAMVPWLLMPAVALLGYPFREVAALSTDFSVPNRKRSAPKAGRTDGAMLGRVCVNCKVEWLCAVVITRQLGRLYGNKTPKKLATEWLLMMAFFRNSRLHGAIV